MKNVDDLDKSELRQIVRRLHNRMYLIGIDADGEETDDPDDIKSYAFEPDKEVGGADLVDFVGELLGRFDLVPEKRIDVVD